MTRYLGLLVTCIALGCAGQTQEQPVASVTTTSAIVAAGIDSDRIPPRIEPKPVETFSDDQILGLLATFNTGEIDLASLVPDRSRDPGVKRFAAVVHKDHSAAREAEARLSERLVM